MSGQAINSIATIIKRLEAATSRLEDLAAGPGAVAGPTTPSASASSRAIVADAGPSSNAPASDPPAVAAFDDYLEQPLKDYADMSERIGGLVAQQAKQVVAAFQAQRSLVKLASSCSKPSGGVSSPIFANLLKPLQESLMAVTDVREKNRSERLLFNHLSAVSEGIPAVGWVAVEPKPGPFVGEMKDSAQFYTNRVIKEFKDKDKTHVEWCRAFIKVFDALKDYIMKTHTTGLSWNPNGGDAATYTDTSAGAAAAVPPPPPPPPAPQAGFDGGAPPPPPPPPAPAAAAPGAGGGAAAGGIDAVFAQLNQGEGITRSLKKVDASQMTHKNPELRNAAAAPAAPSSSSSSKPAPPKPGSKPSALRPKKPANTALEGNKWTVAYHDNNPSVIIDATELNQTVNIYGCKNTVVQIKGKINAVAMVSCQKTSILVDTLVSSLEITSSPSFAVQVTGNVPTILLDSCDSGQIYLAKTAMGAEIVASKCSALNVSVPKEGAEEEGEYTELALPEQLRFGVAGGKLRSEVVAHTG